MIAPTGIRVSVTKIVNIVELLEESRTVNRAFWRRIVRPYLDLAIQTSVYKQADRFIAHRRIGNCGSASQRTQRIVVSNNTVERLALRIERRVIRGLHFRYFRKLDQMKKSEDKARVHHMNIGAITRSFLHSVCEVTKSITGAFRRNAEGWSDSRNNYGYIDTLVFHSSKNGLLRRVLTGFRVAQRISVVHSLFAGQRRTWTHPLWRESSLNHNTI